MGNHQLQIVDSRRIGMSRVFYVDGRVDLGGFGSKFNIINSPFGDGYFE